VTSTVIDTPSTATTADLKECIVVGVKEFIAAEHLIGSEEPARFAQTDIFVCESMYSTALKLFRNMISIKLRGSFFRKMASIFNY